MQSTLRSFDACVTAVSNLFVSSIPRERRGEAVMGDVKKQDARD